MHVCRVIGVDSERCVVVYWSSDNYDGVSAIFYADVYDGAKYYRADYDVFSVLGAGSVDAKKWVWDDIDGGICDWNINSGGVVCGSY